MLTVTSFIDRIICRIFSFEHKIVPWHCHRVAILSTYHHQKSTPSQKAALTCESQGGKCFEESPIPILVARQIVLQLYTQHSVLNKALASGTFSFNPRAWEKSMQLYSAAYGVAVTLQLPPSNSLLSIILAKAIHLHKQMVVDSSPEPATVVVTPRSPLQQQHSMGTTTGVDKSASSDARSVECATHTANGKGKGFTNNVVGATHYIPSITRDFLVQQHARILQYDKMAPMTDCRKEAAISANYQDYRETSTTMAAEF